MRFTTGVINQLSERVRFVKRPALDEPPAQSQPAVVETVSAMLADIRQRGAAAVHDYAERLDAQLGGPVEVSARERIQFGQQLDPKLRAAIELGAERTADFAREARAHLVDFETAPFPGLRTGVKYVPVSRVGAYLPAGRFPLTASAFMTVGVAKVAGVDSVVACTPPQPGGGANAAVAYAAHCAGVDRLFVLGGVQALAAMAFGLLDGVAAADMLVGAGNAYVAEAKRQLFGPVGIDLPAGPSEVAVIADDTGDPELIAADLLGQAEHGLTSPAALVTTSLELAQAVEAEVERQLLDLATADIAGAAWRDHGSITVAADRDAAVLLMDDLAPEHLEIMTSDDDWYHQRLRNYGSIFLGPWSTVAYSDKGMAGTNHTLPTAGVARHSAGLSVARFLKPLTWQRVEQAATPKLAEAVDVISASEGMAAHRATATLRLERLQRLAHAG